MKHKGSLIELIKTTKEVTRYHELEHLIMNDATIKEKIEHLKAMQQQLVHAKDLGHDSNVSHFETKVKEAEQSLLEYPKMAEYLSLQALINDTLQEMMRIIESQLDEAVTLNEKGR